MVPLPRLPLNVISTLTFLFLVPSAGICECEKYLVGVVLKSWQCPRCVGQAPFQLSYIPISQLLKGPSINGNSRQQLAGGDGKTRPQPLELETLVLTPAQQLSIEEDGNNRSALCGYHSVDGNVAWGQSHFLYQVLENIIKGHMQIRQFLEFLCLKSESNSPTLLLEFQMHLN